MAAPSRAEAGTPGAADTAAVSCADHTGTVMWYSEPKGFGFIKPDDQSDAVFVHFSAVEREGSKALTEGERVCFTFSTGPKGKQADKVRVVGGKASP